MIFMRQEQMKAFEQAGLANFQNSMVGHVKEYFPNHYRIAGEPVVLDVIRYGIDNGGKYGFVGERDLCLYITVMFMLGSNFDSDFMYPWAREILVGEMPDPSERAVALADKALDFMKEIGGPENRHINRAFLGLRKELPAIMEDREIGELKRYAKTKLQKIFPAKFEALGETVVARLVEEGTVAATKYNIRSKAGHALYIGMMFFMGSAMDREPFLPWVGKILNDKSLAENGGTEKRLYDETRAFLEKWLEKP